MEERKKGESSIVGGKRKNTINYARDGIEDYEEQYRAAYKAREVEMDSVFSRTVKLVDELLSRVEREITRGMQYKGDQDPRMSTFDPKVSKAAEGLGKLVAQLQSIHLRLLKEGERQAKNMSREDKIVQVVKFIQKLPLDDQERIQGDLGWDA